MATTFTQTINDQNALINTAANPAVVNLLPSSSMPTRPFVYGKQTSDANTVTLQAAAGDNISGSGSLILSTVGTVTIKPTASGWIIIAQTAVTTTGSGGGGSTGPLTLAFNGAAGVYQQAYAGSLQATGGTQPYAYSIVGSLPSWATLNTSTGQITGIPTSTGTTTFTGKVTDSAGSPATQTVSCTITVTAVGATGPVANVTGFTAVPNFYPKVPLAANGGQQWNITIQATTPSDPRFDWGQLVLKPDIALLTSSLASGAVSMTVGVPGVATTVAVNDYLQVDSEIVLVTAVSRTTFTETYTVTRGQFTADGFSPSTTVHNIGAPVFDLSQNGKDFVQGLPIVNAGVSSPVTGPVWPMGYPTYFIAYCVSTNLAFTMNAYPIPPTGGATPLTPQTAPFLVQAAVGSTIGAETPNMTGVSFTVNTYPAVPLSSIGAEQWNVTIAGTAPVNSTTGQVDSRFTDGLCILKPAFATLASAMTAVQTTLTLQDSGARYPSGWYTNVQNGDYLQVDTEIVKVTGGAGTLNLTITRGTPGPSGSTNTTAATHAANIGVFDLSNASNDVWSGPPRIMAAGPYTVSGPIWPMGGPAYYIFYLVSQDDGVSNTYPVWGVTPQSNPTLVQTVTSGHLNLSLADPTTAGSGLYANSGNNIMLNPGFELLPLGSQWANDPTGYIPTSASTVLPTGWSIAATGSSPTPHSGSYVLEIPAADLGTLSNVGNLTSCSPGQQFLGSAWVLSTAGATGSLFLAIAWYNVSGGLISDSIAIPPASTSWELITVTGTAPSGAVQCRLVIQMASAGTGTWYVDDTSFVQLPPAGVGLGYDPSGNLMLTVGNVNNMVSNPGFEVLPLGANWALTNATVVSGAAPSGNGGTTGSHTGACYVQLTAGSVAKAQQGPGTTSGQFPCQAGQVYTCTVWYRGGSGADTLNIYYNWFNAAGTATNGISANFGAVTGWTQASFTFTMPFGATSFNILVRAPSNAANFYLDDMVLTQAPSVTGVLGVDSNGNLLVNLASTLSGGGNTLGVTLGSLSVGYFQPSAGASGVALVQYGFFSTVGGSGNTTLNSTVLSLSGSPGVVNGYVVTGPGIAPGTTVSSSSGATIYLSQGANATLSGSYSFVALPALPNAAYPSGSYLQNNTTGRMYYAKNGTAWVDQGDPGDVAVGVLSAGVVVAGSAIFGQLTAATIAVNQLTGWDGASINVTTGLTFIGTGSSTSSTNISNTGIYISNNSPIQCVISPGAFKVQAGNSDASYTELGYSALYIDGTQVVGARQAGPGTPNFTSLSVAQTWCSNLYSALKTHGLLT